MLNQTAQQTEAHEMTSTAAHSPATWTIAYRNPRANAFKRAGDYAGTWAQAAELAQIFSSHHPDQQVYYVPTAAAEAQHPGHEDSGNVLVDSGRRVRILETGSAGEYAAWVTPPAEAEARGHAQATVVAGGTKPQEGLCFRCRRRVFLCGPRWTLVYVAYARPELCDARGMEAGHEPMCGKPVEQTGLCGRAPHGSGIQHIREDEPLQVSDADEAPCPSMHPGFPGLTCSLTDGHTPDHSALGYTWPNLRTDDRCSTCHRDAHRPGMPTENHGHAYSSPAAQLRCCGVWIAYPPAGGESRCGTCLTVFTVTAACPDGLVSCENCSAPCDGTLTAHSELFDEDLPVCADCHVSLQLTDALSESGCVCRLGPDCPAPGSCDASALAAGEAGPWSAADLAASHATQRRRAPWAVAEDHPQRAAYVPVAEEPYQPRHAGHVWDIPSDYTGTRRAGVSFADRVSAQGDALSNGTW
jgi:hypothetical protein